MFLMGKAYRKVKHIMKHHSSCESKDKYHPYDCPECKIIERSRGYWSI